MWKRSMLIVAATAVLAWGCASAGTGEARRDTTVLTAAELEDSGRQDAFSAVRQLRPMWLRSRGITSSDRPVQVYMDGVRVGSVEELRNISVSSVERLQYYDARRAQTRFGPGHPNGVIEVVTRSY